MISRNWKKSGLVAVFALACFGGGFAARSFALQSPVAGNANIPTNMKQYFVAFLVKSDKWKDGESDAAIGPLVVKHLEFVRAQSEKGKFALAGPFLDQGRILGMAVVNANSPEEVKVILDGDPFMPTGLVAVEVHPVYLADLSAVKFEYAN